MRKIIVDGVGRPTFDFRTGLDDSRGVRLLALQLLQFTSRLGRLRLSLGLARRRLLGQACVEINQ